jgi:hypothetical protein
LKRQKYAKTLCLRKLTPARSEGKYFKLGTYLIFRFLSALRQHAGSKDFFFLRFAHSKLKLLELSSFVIYIKKPQRVIQKIPYKAACCLSKVKKR